MERNMMTIRKKDELMDALLLGNVDWEKARKAAYEMASQLTSEVANLDNLKDAYSPMAWINICRQLRVVTDGMTTMRLIAEGKNNATISTEAHVTVGSIAAYKAWNTMYLRMLNAGIQRRVPIKGRTKQEKNLDADFLRSCGIEFDVVPHIEKEEGTND
jgi:uncharacterized protein YerC